MTLRANASRLTLLAFMVVASHAVLDTFTDGGLGCALFWPSGLGQSHERVIR